MGTKSNFDIWWQSYKTEEGYEVRDTYNVNVVSDAFYAGFHAGIAAQEKETVSKVQIATTREAVNQHIGKVEDAIKIFHDQMLSNVVRHDRDIEKLQETIKGLESEMLYMKNRSRKGY
jgi:hypothetical protein